MAKENLARAEDRDDDDRGTGANRGSPGDRDDDDHGRPAPGEQEDGSYRVSIDSLKDERGAKKGGDDRGEDEDLPIDVRTALESAGDENEEIRQRRREERRRKREEQRAREEEKDSRIANLENTVQALIGDRTAQQQGSLRDAYEKAEDEKVRLVTQYNEAKALKEKAFAASDAKGLVEADEIMNSARERYASLNAQQARIISIAKSEEQRQQQQQQRRVDPNIERGAKAFMAENTWYDPAGTDRQSARVLAIDRQMFREGWDPRTPGYWEELQARVDEEGLGERRGNGGGRDDRDDDRDRGQRRRQYTGSGGGRDSQSGGEVTIPAAYVRNLKEAGMWDDVKIRNKMIRRYIESQKGRR